MTRITNLIMISCLIFATACSDSSHDDASDKDDSPHKLADAGDPGDSTDAVEVEIGASLEDCTTACEKVSGICEYEEDERQSCIDDCQNAVNAAEALRCIDEAEMDAICSYQFCHFTTEHELFCNPEAPPADQAEYYAGTWSHLGGQAVFEFTSGFPRFIGSTNMEKPNAPHLVANEHGAVLITFSTEADDDDDDDEPARTLAAKFSDGNWQTLGELTGSDGVEPKELSAALSPDGTPYIAWNGGAGESGPAGIPNTEVKKWNGSAWINLGPPFEAFGIGKIIFDKDANPVVVASGAAHVWDGNQWNQIGEKFESNRVDLLLAPSGEIFALIKKVTSHGADLSIKKWDGNTWIFLGEDPLFVGTEAVTIYSDAKIAVDPNGTPHLLFKVNFNNVDSSFYDAAYLYKWTGTAWEKAAESDCHKVPNTDLGLASIHGDGVHQIDNFVFDRTGALVYSRPGDSPNAYRLFDDTRALPLDTSTTDRCGFGICTGHSVGGGVISPDGSNFYGWFATKGLDGAPDTIHVTTYSL